MGPRLLTLGLLVALVALSGAKKDKKKKLSKKAMMGLEIEALKENLTELWQQVTSGGPPVHVHMHGSGDVMEDHMHSGDGTHVHIHLDSGEASHGHENLLEDDGYFHAQCNIHPGSGSSSSVKGSIFFKQKEGGPLQMRISLEGFNVSGGHEHGFHLHHYGDLSRGCASLGGHFNPHATTHGGMGDNQHQRHAGDWGNIRCDMAGRVETFMEDRHTTLLGKHSILGRGIVIHEGVDDLGLGGRPDSHATGAAGGRLACCVVTWHTKSQWQMPESAADHAHHHGNMRHGRHRRQADHHHHHHHHQHEDDHHKDGHFDGDGHDHHQHEHLAHPEAADFRHEDHWDHVIHGERHHHDHTRHRRQADHHHHHQHEDDHHKDGHYDGDGHDHHQHEHLAHPDTADFRHEDHWDHVIHGERHHHH